MLLRHTQFIPLSFKQDLLVPLSPSIQGLHLPHAPLLEQEQKRMLLESVSMTKAAVNGFVQPQYFPQHIQAPVRFLFTQHLFIIYITTPNHVGVLLNVLSADSHFVAFCYCFGIVLSIYDLFGARRGQCACKYPRPIMPAVFVRQLSSLRGVDEGRVGVGWGGGMALYGVFFGGSFMYTCTYARTRTYPSVPPKPI